MQNPVNSASTITRSKEIVFRSTMDLADYLAYAKAHQYATGGRWGLRVLCMFGLVVTIAGGVGVYWGLAGGQFWLVLAIGVYYFVKPISYSYSLRKYFHRLKEKPTEVEVAVCSEFVVVKKRGRETRLKWDCVSKVVDSLQGLLLYIDDETPLAWIPSRVIKSREATAEVLAFAERNGARTIHIGGD